MKKVLFLALTALFTINPVFSQEEKICDLIPSKNGKVFYTEVVNVENSKSIELYNNAKMWIASTFKSAKSVIQSDVEGTSIVVKGRLNYVTDGDSPFILTIQFKDGRYKYELTDLYMDMNIAGKKVTYPIENAPFIKNCSEKPLEGYNKFILSFIDELKSGIDVSDDW
ncbi:DUF4468 domain-containing protein [Proteiniphilum sp.]|uniref:DUF4468 domain-containing protein n=1 Tax=Proteiniphilum sp. TaxID=1926877 RepID=UPI00332952D3